MIAARPRDTNTWWTSGNVVLHRENGTVSAYSPSPKDGVLTPVAVPPRPGHEAGQLHTGISERAPKTPRDAEAGHPGGD